MKMKLFTILFIGGISVLSWFTLIGCSGGQTKESVENAVDSDSISRADSIANLPLPDKQLESVKDLVYSVTILDSTVDGRIDDLSSLYENHPNSYTFRGGPLRDANYGGKVKGNPTKILKVWSFETGYDTSHTILGTWGGGSGWTGQPVFVRWDKEHMARFKKESPALTADFDNEEIMVGSLCCKVYFINFKTGKASREPLDTTNPIKGSIGLDPHLNGNLYVGQGVPKVNPVGQMAFNLYTHKQTYFSGRDNNAWCGWGASDSSPVVVGNFLIWPRENGTVYKYYIDGNTIRPHSTLRFHSDRGATGIENSICIYKNYGWVANNHGTLICIDLNTMKPIWYYDMTDDVDASVVCEVENGVPYIYCGCEVDRQGNTGISHFVKLNGLNGEEVWHDEIPCTKLNLGGKHFDGGFYATPLPGRGDCDSLIFANVCQREGSRTAEFTAFNKKTGAVVYRIGLHSFAWSSPVGFLNEKNKLYIFAGDACGYGYLIDAKKGEIVDEEYLCDNFESSPVVIGNQFVVGSRGNKINKFEIK